MGYVDEATYELEAYEEECEDVWRWILHNNPGVPQEFIEMMFKKLIEWNGDEYYKDIMKYVFNMDTTECDQVHRVLTYSYEEWCENFWETLND